MHRRPIDLTPPEQKPLVRAFATKGMPTLPNMIALWFLVLTLVVAALATAEARPLQEAARNQPADPEAGSETTTPALGVGEVAGMTHGHVDGHRWVAIEFAGDTLATLGSTAMVEPVVSLSGGELVAASIEPLRAPGHWRLFIAFDPGDERAIDMRASLKLYSQAVTETWTYGWER